jgi:hypothetical protein
LLIKRNTAAVIKIGHLFVLFLQALKIKAMDIKLKTWGSCILLFLCVPMWVSAQRVFNLNSNKITLRNAQEIAPSQITNDLGEPLQVRAFDYNPELKSITKENKGDMLALDFFEGRQYRGVIQNVSHYNDITSISAKILDSEYSFCYLTISDSGILISTDIPGSENTFLTIYQNSNTYLARYSTSTLKEKALICEEVFPQDDITPVGIPLTTDDGHENEPISVQTRSIEKNTETLPAALSGCGNTNLNAPVTIKVLTPYTTAAKNYANAHGGITEIISQAFIRANQAMTNSNTKITFENAYSFETNYSGTTGGVALEALSNTNDGLMDEVHELRKTYDADLVMLFMSLSLNDVGGIGYVLTNEGGFPGNAFALTRVEQASWTYTMAHEIGHNMGCAHHKLQEGSYGLYSYSYGWRGTNNIGKYSTIMTYENLDDGKGNFPGIGYFSDPDMAHEGVYIGDADVANNALTLLRTKLLTSLYSEAINVALQKLEINSGSLTPAFNPNTTAYTVTVPNSVSTISISGEANFACATVSGAVSNKPLNMGNNVFSISAVSHDNKISKTYTVTVKREMSNCYSYENYPAFGNNVTAESGESALNLNMGQIAPAINQNPLTIETFYERVSYIMKESESSNRCYHMGDGNSFFGSKSFKVSKDGTYTFYCGRAVFMTLHDSETPSCSNFITSSGYWNSSYSYTYSSRITVTLEAHKTYYMNVINSSNAVFDINISGPGSCFYESTMPSDMGYTYIAVNQTNDKVSMQSPTADFRALTAGNYVVYGISYSTKGGAKPADFIGKTLQELNDSYCIIPSKTQLNMTVTTSLVNAATPVITNQPQSATCTLNEPATPLTINATRSDAGNLSYQWYRNTTNRNTGGTSLGTASGAQTNTYTPPTSTVGTTYYYAIVTNTNNAATGTKTASTTSNTAAVTVKPLVYGISIGTLNGGTVRAESPSSSDGSAVIPGETVTLRITPENGYQLSTIEAYKTDESTATITLTGSGSTRTFTMPNYGITITATFDKTPDQQNVESAKSIIETMANLTSEQITANTENAIKAWLAAQINAYPPLAATGIQVTAADITLTSFSPATAGTYTNPNGTNGSFSFTISLKKGNSTTLTTTPQNGTITAIPYDSNTTYHISIHITTNGTITSNPSTSAKAGETITLTILPAEGYELNSLTTTPTLTLAGSANTRTFHMPAEPVAISATFRKTQALQDKEAVETAKIALEGGAYQIAQATGNTPSAIKEWLIATLNAMFGRSHNLQARSSQEPILGDVTITSLTAATEGTPSSPAGINGSYHFTVTLNCGNTTLTTAEISGIITATPYTITPLKRIELLPLSKLTIRILNTGNVETGKLHITLTGLHNNAFKLSETTLDNLPAADSKIITLTPQDNLETGDYTATVTVTGTDIPPASIHITHTVSDTGSDPTLPSTALTAWMHNNKLHIKGLTVGQPWSIYHISGSLIHHTTAESTEATTTLPSRGVYIIKSGTQVVKAIYSR